MPTLPRILRHLFTTTAKAEDDDLRKSDEDVKSESEKSEHSSAASKADTKLERNSPHAETEDSASPETCYLTLDLGDKLRILMWLCDMSLASKVIRNYIDDCEIRLTEERREKADINRERKELWV